MCPRPPRSGAREKKWPPGHEKTRFCTQKRASQPQSGPHQTGQTHNSVPPASHPAVTVQCCHGVHCTPAGLLLPARAPAMRAALRPPSRCDQGGARAGTAAAPRRAGRAAARTTAAVAAAARAARTGATATAASRGRRRRGRGVRAQSPEAARAAPAGEQSCAAGSSPPCPAIACGQKNRPPCCWCSSTGNGGASRGGSAHPPPWMGADESA